MRVVIDAAVSGAAPGTIHRVDATHSPLPFQPPPASTHQLGLARVIELGRILDQLPERLIVLGIEARNWSPGAGMSEEVLRGVEEAVERALEEVQMVETRKA